MPIERVGDLQAFGVGNTQSSYHFFQDQVVNLQALPLEEADSALVLL